MKDRYAHICGKFYRDQGDSGDINLYGDINDKIVDTYAGFVGGLMSEATNITGV